MKLLALVVWVKTTEKESSYSRSEKILELESDKYASIVAIRLSTTLNTEVVFSENTSLHSEAACFSSVSENSSTEKA